MPGQLSRSRPDPLLTFCPSRITFTTTVETEPDFDQASELTQDYILEQMEKIGNRAKESLQHMGLEGENLSPYQIYMLKTARFMTYWGTSSLEFKDCPDGFAESHAPWAGCDKLFIDGGATSELLKSAAGSPYVGIVRLGVKLPFAKHQPNSVFLEQD